MKPIIHITSLLSLLFTLALPTSTPNTIPIIQSCLLLVISKLMFKVFLSGCPFCEYTLLWSVQFFPLFYVIPSLSLSIFQQLSVHILVFSGNLFLSLNFPTNSKPSFCFYMCWNDRVKVPYFSQLL
jgi:hypothetical protein